MNSKLALKLGAILTALSLVKILYSYFINSPYEKDYSMVVNIIATIIFLAAEVVILVLAFRNYKKINIENRKLLTIGNGLKISTIAYLIQALIGNLTNALIYASSDELMQKAINQIKVQYAKTQLSPEQVKVAMEYAIFMLKPKMIFISGFIGTLIGGLVLSLIILAFVREKETISNIKTE